MKFKVFGPFVLPRNSNKSLVAHELESRREFWWEVDESNEGLSKACGCYVFCIQTGGGTLPWYVGKTEKRSFSKECLQAHKIVHYNSACTDRKGTPQLYLVPQLTKGGRFRKPTTGKRAAISSLESILIGFALSRNPGLLNIKGTAMLKNLEVPGLINAKGGGRSAGSKLKSILDLS